VHVRAAVRITAAGDYYQTFLLTLATRLRREILVATPLSRDRLDSYLAQLQAHLDAPDTITSQPAMWQAWGTKP
jgi:hypothetical protein